MEYHNAVLWCSEFEALAGTQMWIGPVHPGDVGWPGARTAGEQVVLEFHDAQRLRYRSTTRLRDDLGGAWVHQGATGNA